jgi:hypothetical protein
MPLFKRFNESCEKRVMVAIFQLNTGEYGQRRVPERNQEGE